MDASKLKLVPQENKDDSLRTETFPDDEVGSCIWELQKGVRKGNPCGEKTFDGNEYCSKHRSLLEIRNSATSGEQKQKGTVTHSIEIIEPAVLNTGSSSVSSPAPKLRQAPTTKNMPTPSTLTVADMMGILQIFSDTVVEMTKSLRDRTDSNGHV